MSTATSSTHRAILCELVDPETGRYVFGHGVIIPGEASQEAVEAAMTVEHGNDWDRIISEVQHLTYVPRLKWCSDHGTTGCDDEGEWHAHWLPVKHNGVKATCCHTVALPVMAPPDHHDRACVCLDCLDAQAQDDADEQQAWAQDERSDL